jgi:exosortase E/protease (VPEID-CTERM system)
MPSSRYIKRIIAISILLLAEYIIYTYFFDFVVFSKLASPLKVIGNIGTVAPVWVISMALLLLLYGKKLKKDILNITASVSFKPDWWLWGLHILLYLLLVLITTQLYHNFSWLPLWAGASVLLIITALFIAFPPQVLKKIIVQDWNILIIGLIAGLITWLTMLTSAHLWGKLSRVTFLVVAKLLSILPAEKVVNPDLRILGTAQFTVGISNSCSGIEGIGLMVAFISMYFIVRRKEVRFPAALILYPVGTGLIWFVNAVRIFLLVAIGSAGFPDVAVGGFHSKAGVIFFCIVAFSIIVLTGRLKVFYKTDIIENRDAGSNWNPTALYLLPFLIAVATALLTGLFTSSFFDQAYVVRILTAAIVLVVYSRQVFKGTNFNISAYASLAGIAVAVLWIVLDLLLSKNSAAITEGSPSPWWIVAKCIGSCTVIPIIEELAFRGFLSRRLINRNFTEVPFTAFTWTSFVVSSVAFGLMHGQRWIAGVIAGMVFLFVMYRKGRLLDAIIAHAVSNAVIAGYVLFLGKWILW